MTKDLSGGVNAISPKGRMTWAKDGRTVPASPLSTRGGPVPLVECIAELAEELGMSVPNICSDVERMEPQVKTAPGTLCANSESDSQGLANRLEGTVN